MTDAFAPIMSQNSGTSESAKRAAATAAALELIKAYAGSGNPKFSLSDQMKMLLTYTDQIQEALKTK